MRAAFKTYKPINIFLFDMSMCHQEYLINPLRDFITYLNLKTKQNKERPQLRIDSHRYERSFSYSAGPHSLHPDLSIKENYVLDGLSFSLIKQQEDYFCRDVEKLDNIYLKMLISETNCTNRKVFTLTLSEKSLVSIVKSILSESRSIFLNSPENYLTSSHLNLLKKALYFEASLHKRQVFISSRNPNLWPDLATFIVTKVGTNNYDTCENSLSKSPIATENKASPNILEDMTLPLLKTGSD